MVSPSPSILKHEEPVQPQDKKRNGTRGYEGAGPADGSSLHAIFLRSRLVEPAERGNTELRNAVQSAANSGFQSDFLRVNRPKSKAYEDHSWIYYIKVNEAFAERIARRVPAMPRKLLPDVQIRFFFQVAFPSSEVFQFPALRKELLEGMLGADRRILRVDTNEGVHLDNRFVNVGTGIDPKSWDERRKSLNVDHWIKLIAERYDGKRLIVSRDKLDQIHEWRDKVNGGNGIETSASVPSAAGLRIVTALIGGGQGCGLSTGV
ncbi:hypothetical protein V8E54_006652 [Elaphomyces granulatus]